MARWRSPRSRVMLPKPLPTRAMLVHVDLVANDGADTAADFGRSRQQDGVIIC